MAESEEELKNLLMKVKEESENLASNSTFKKLRSWHLVPSFYGKYGETMETVTDFILRGSKFTADGAYSCDFKNAFFLEEKL